MLKKKMKTYIIKMNQDLEIVEVEDVESDENVDILDENQQYMELNMPVRIVFVDDIHFDATTAVDVI
jgi:uncharacterized protein (DUF1499 family)